MPNSPYTAQTFAAPPPVDPVTPETRDSGLSGAQSPQATSPTQSATPAPGSPSSPLGPGAPTAADVEEALRDVIDPELGINVVDLGLLYGVAIDQNGAATVDMTLTSAACPLTGMIESQAAAALEGLVTDVDINWVWMPPWGPDRITPDGREQLRAIGFNV